MRSRLGVEELGARPKVPVSTLVSTITGYSDALTWGPLLLSLASSGALPPGVAAQLRMGGVAAIVTGGLRALLGTREILDQTDSGIADRPAKLRVAKLGFADFYK